MSSAQLSRHASRASRSRSSRTSDRPNDQLQYNDLAHDFPPYDTFEPCAATASYLLYAQGSSVLVLHHDTLAIERRFDAHDSEIRLISVDTVSDRYAGRVVVSYDASAKAIIWDLFSGEVRARFESYEPIRVAKFQRDGTIAFGGSKGNITLFDHTTSEHLSTRTINDPITALAPANDCETFAIGYQNGSIFIAKVQPGFSVLHTINSGAQPAPVTELAWHASSSKQKTEMLATQLANGELRVWNVAKPPHNEAPRVIRYIRDMDNGITGPCWFAWSKSGRIVEHCDGATHTWDVRTKQLERATVPTITGPTAMVNYGPSATLFTLGGDYSIQQYDLNPNSFPLLVTNVQYLPSNPPPSPPDSIEAHGGDKLATQAQAGQMDMPIVGSSRASALPIELDVQSSEDDGGPVLSPLEKMTREQDMLEEERRDFLGPLSPVSSHTSLSSASSYGHRRRPRTNSRSNRERSYSSKMSESTGYNGTTFSDLSSVRSSPAHNSMLSSSSYSSLTHKSSSRRLHHSAQAGPAADASESTGGASNAPIDLFPYVRMRLSEVKFVNPEFPDTNITPDLLRQEMIKCVFGWDGEAEHLILDELDRHEPSSTAAILLSTWLGNIDPEQMHELGGQSLTSSDWMFLALSSMGGPDAQKRMADVMLKRLLQNGDVHSAVAIFLGRGELDEAVEAYVTHKYYLEATLLTCHIFPSDWQRISHLVRQWGEWSVKHGQHPFAVRCFACTGMVPSEPWFSPRTQDAMYTASMQSMQNDSPISTMSPQSQRLNVKNAGLKLNTDFAANRAAAAAAAANKGSLTAGITPIADTASPGGERRWQKQRSSSKGSAFPDSAATATPGYYAKRRLPSATRTPQTAFSDATVTGDRDIRRLATPDSSVLRARNDRLPSPAHGVFAQLREQSRSRDDSRDRNARGLHLEVVKTVEDPNARSPQPLRTGSTRGRAYSESISSASVEGSEMSPLPTGSSLKSSKGRSIDQYISSLDEANYHTSAHSYSNRQRSNSTEPGRALGRSQQRETSENRGRSGTRYIKPAKRSPSSPVALSSSDANNLRNMENVEQYQDERYYGVTSPRSPQAHAPLASASAPRGARSRSRAGGSAKSSRPQSPDARPGQRSTSKSLSRSRATSRQRPGEDTANDRGRSEQRGMTASRSSSSASPPPRSHLRGTGASISGSIAAGDESRAKSRQRSRSRRPSDAGAGASERGARERSTSRRPRQREMSRERPVESLTTPIYGPGEHPMSLPSSRAITPRTLTRKELAAKELEERRLSLARRPSAPLIPMPGEISGNRTPTSPLSALEGGGTINDLLRGRSHTADPEMSRSRTNAAAAATPAPIGLPATPRAMRHPRHMASDSDQRNGIPAVPALPSNAETLSAVTYDPSKSSTAATSNDTLGQLLPATTFVPMRSAPPRSASAPPTQTPPTLSSARFEGPPPRSHARQTSTADRDFANDAAPSTRRASPPYADVISEEVDEDEVIDVPEIEQAPVTPPPPPPMLAELQHLAIAGPSQYQMAQQQHPTSAHTSVSSKGSLAGTINIAMDGTGAFNSRSTTPATDLTHPGSSFSPSLQRKGSVSIPEHTTSPAPVSATSDKGSNSITSKWRNVADRMRSNSRSRSRQAPEPSNTPSPYETRAPELPMIPQRLTSPMNNGPASTSTSASAAMPPPPPPVPAGGSIIDHQAQYLHSRQYSERGGDAMGIIVPPLSIPAGPTLSAATYSARPDLTRSNSAFAGSMAAPPLSAGTHGNAAGLGLHSVSGTVSYRNPREVRANMPPETLQAGVYNPNAVV